MKICQITTTVSGGLQFSAYPCLAFKQFHLNMWIFCSGKRRCHTGGPGTDDSNYHAYTFFLF